MLISSKFVELCLENTLNERYTRNESISFRYCPHNSLSSERSEFSRERCDDSNCSIYITIFNITITFASNCFFSLPKLAYKRPITSLSCLFSDSSPTVNASSCLFVDDDARISYTFLTDNQSYTLLHVFVNRIFKFLLNFSNMIIFTTNCFL